MPNELIQIKESYSIAEIEDIRKKTGYNLAIPADQNDFLITCKSIKYVVEHPDYYDSLKDKTTGVLTSRTRYYVTVRNIKNFCGEAYCQALLSVAITDLCKFFNIGKNMDVEQIKQTTEVMIQDPLIWGMSLVEIRDCFDRIKAGTLGTIYDRIDGNVIIEKMYKYMDKRINFLYL